MIRLILVLLLLLTGCGPKTEPSFRNPSPESSLASDVGHMGTVDSLETARCLKAAAAKGNTVVELDQRQTHLRGDFDADGVLDIAVAIRGLKTGRNGVLICSGKNEVSVLGADNSTTPPFSDMQGDNFVAPEWKVFTKAEAERVHDVDRDPGKQVAFPTGDCIAMIWEDGICLIWWDRMRYKWSCGQ